ncbi:MAG: sigma-70 family RNA polymerase sigma factor [Paraperlucidibaca sp.]
MAADLAQLIAATAEGDRRAFEDLYQATSPKLYALAISVLRNRDHAQEVLQEAYINIWRSAATYNISKGSVQTWLNVIVRHRCIDRIRHAPAPTEELSLLDWSNIEASGPSPLQLVQADAEAVDLARCMHGLGAPQQRALSLSFFHGLTHRELAEKLKLPLGSVKSHVRRGLENLRRCLHHATL